MAKIKWSTFFLTSAFFITVFLCVTKPCLSQIAENRHFFVKPKLENEGGGSKRQRRAVVKNFRFFLLLTRTKTRKIQKRASYTSCLIQALVTRSIFCFQSFNRKINCYCYQSPINDGTQFWTPSPKMTVASDKLLYIISPERLHRFKK